MVASAGRDATRSEIYQVPSAVRLRSSAERKDSREPISKKGAWEAGVRDWEVDWTPGCRGQRRRA